MGTENGTSLLRAKTGMLCTLLLFHPHLFVRILCHEQLLQ